jgi:serine/threonine protein kinase/tetratricopeptide (TPR) repeat protein
MDPQRDDPSALPLAPGDHIGPYVVRGRIGQGGMGQVFLADDSRLRRKVALKYLYGSLTPEEAVRTTLMREAEAAARITHPNVAMVYDVIEHDDHPFIVMEYVEGESLAASLSRGRLQIAETIQFATQMESELAAAQGKGIIHRDLKPSNIQVTAEGTVKILDFGIAKVREMLWTAPATLSATVSVGGHHDGETACVGTLGYMSPEQMLGRRVDATSDLFSLGVVLFEMATAQRLFAGTSALEIVAAMGQPVRRANAVNVDVPSELAEIIENLLQFNPSARIGSARDLEMRLATLSINRESSRQVGVPEVTIRTLRGRLILANGPAEVVRLKYEVEQYLSERPNDVDGRVLRDDVERALSLSGHGLSPGARLRERPAWRPSPTWYAASILIAIAIGSLFVYRAFLSSLASPPSSEATISKGPTPPDPTTPIRPSAPVFTPPASPTRPQPELLFQDHFSRAQVLIAEGNRAAARRENLAALSALPDDPRGLAQRAAIDALADTSVAAAPAAAAPPSPAITLSPTPNPPAIAETLQVTARAGETNAQRASRERTAKGHLEDGKKALAEQKWVNAIDLLQAALTTSGRQDYGTVANEAARLLARAQKERDGFVVAQRTATARGLVAEAKALGISDIPQALQKLRDARELDADAEGATELQNALQEQARSQGEKALSSAKNLDNRNRADQAIRQYERAVQLLELVPGGHKDLALARQRLAQLKR